MSSQSHVTEIQRRRKAYQRMWKSILCTIYSPSRHRLKTCKCVARRLLWCRDLGSVVVLNAKIWILKGKKINACSHHTLYSYLVCEYSILTL
jgi:hypothetical protein